MKEVHTTYGRRLYAIAGMVMTAIGVVGLILDRRNSSLWDVALAVILTAIGVATLVRSPRLGLAFDEHTLKVRGVLWTRSFDRSRASVSMKGHAHSAAVPRVRVAGKAYPVYGMTAGPWPASQRNVMELLVENGLMKQPR